VEISAKTVMLTGGVRIGQEVVKQLAAAGANRFLLTYHHSQDTMKKLAAELMAMGATAIAHPMDATSPISVTEAVKIAMDAYGGIDILLNLASTYHARVTAELTLTEWQLDLNANATSTFLCMQAVAPLMRHQGAGRIINFADWTVASGRVNYPAYAAYYAAKKTVIGLTEAFALEYAPEILINCIAPGPILSPQDLPAQTAAEIAATTPLGRWGGATEIAEAVKFLIRTNFVTGECIRVDGGRHLR
jgi:NAD(P)-dependent dehydrogenase (short-subunit alcohol dehydrogenase family)